MDKISIETIFNGNSLVEINANTICSNEDKTYNEKSKFSIERLLTIKKNKNNNLIREYEKIYKICLDKIDSVNSIGKTELLYKIPLFMYSHQGYDPYQCLNFIKKRLIKLKLDIYDISRDEILISWFNLEKKIRTNI
jgi:hypothetical protein